MAKPIAVLTKKLFKQNKGRSIVAVTAIALTTHFVLSRSMSKNLVEMTFRQTGYDAQAPFNWNEKKKTVCACQGEGFVYFLRD